MSLEHSKALAASAKEMDKAIDQAVKLRDDMENWVDRVDDLIERLHNLGDR